MRKSLREFNPIKAATTELGMWQAYYDHNFIKLFFQLLIFFKVLFNFNLYQSLKAAYFCGTATILFRRVKGKETAESKQKMFNSLINLYRLISEQCLEEFDFVEVAKLELEWWFVDRYPEKYSYSREEAMVRVMSNIYTTPKELLFEYAEFRSRAMVLQDEFEHGKVDKIDWEMVHNLLNMSYQSLFKAVNN